MTGQPSQDPALVMSALDAMVDSQSSPSLSVLYPASVFSLRGACAWNIGRPLPLIQQPSDLGQPRLGATLADGD